MLSLVTAVLGERVVVVGVVVVEVGWLVLNLCPLAGRRTAQLLPSTVVVTLVLLLLLGSATALGVIGKWDWGAATRAGDAEAVTDESSSCGVLVWGDLGKLMACYSRQARITLCETLELMGGKAATAPHLLEAVAHAAEEAPGLALRHTSSSSCQSVVLT